MIITKVHSVDCRFCCWRISSTVAKRKRQPLSTLVVQLANRFCGTCCKTIGNNRYKESRQLYKRHSLSLLKAKVYRSDYSTGALEGNWCSRLLDAVAMVEIPFEAQAESYLDALRALKSVIDKCLGKLVKWAGGKYSYLQGC